MLLPVQKTFTLYNLVNRPVVKVNVDNLTDEILMYPQDVVLDYRSGKRSYGLDVGKLCYANRMNPFHKHTTAENKDSLVIESFIPSRTDLVRKLIQYPRTQMSFQYGFAVRRFVEWLDFECPFEVDLLDGEMLKTAYVIYSEILLRPHVGGRSSKKQRSALRTLQKGARWVVDALHQVSEDEMAALTVDIK